MTHRFFPRLLLAIGVALFAGTAAQAACYADYKAKQDDPLKLHYGVVQLPDAACDAANSVAPIVAEKIAAGGWTLLNVLGVFGDEGLAERKASAGDYFLRF